MSRKDYVKIAEVIKWQLLPHKDKVVLAHSFADMLQADNPNFKRETFLKACGVK